MRSTVVSPVESDGDGVGDLAQQGFGIGSNGFPGFKPQDASENDRTSWAAYVDLEADVLENLTLGIAGRYEDYDDFGDTINGKSKWLVDTEVAEYLQQHGDSGGRCAESVRYHSDQRPFLTCH